MNKYLFVLLAICLVSVHAFVKRDAPAEGANSQNYLEDLQRQIETLSKTVSEKLKEALNPDDIKKHFNEFSTNVNKAIDGLKENKA